MSAAEVIEEIKLLPPEEQRKVLSFLQDSLGLHAAEQAPVRYAVDADFEQVADQVFRENDDLFRRLAQ